MDSHIESGKVLVKITRGTIQQSHNNLRVTYQALQASLSAIERSRQLIARSDRTASELRIRVPGSHAAARISSGVKELTALLGNGIALPPV